ncbi:GHKL domain-containing protein [Granulicatella balaenopterae]|uniref:GHKL domain-containing protein n=1 Tax=Granulicatella balaenopterae TaxID=137733 RepID=A0A1H9NUJ6_9LACT|nr:GHKL domain-containing protein [Granulicatella balaenopterae]SER39447.1 GHKL domain-containing protein [Granulicatella balaenopterae]
MIGAIELVTFIIIYWYNIFFVEYCSNLLEIKNKIIIKIYPILLSCILIVLVCNQVNTGITYILAFLVQLGMLKVVFSNSIIEIYILLIYQIFHMIINRDIVIGIFSIIFKISMHQVVHSYELYILSFALGSILILVLGGNFEKICDINMAKKLLINSKELKGFTITITSLVMILLNSNYTYYYADNIRGITINLLINRICILICFYCLLSMTMALIKWVEEEILYKSNLLNLEYNETLNKKIEEYSYLLRMYNHDFKKVLLNIKDAIIIGNEESALNIIATFNDRIHELSSYNKKMSNNPLINALMNRCSKECLDKAILFDSDCYIPEDFNVSELDLVNIFNNLSSNAFEACIKQADHDDRRIKFKSYVKDENLIIYQSNTFNGHINIKNNKLLTTKENKLFHGIGMESVKHIAREANGMVLIKVDKEKREFKCIIKIPLN